MPTPPTVAALRWSYFNYSLGLKNHPAPFEAPRAQIILDAIMETIKTGKICHGKIHFVHHIEKINVPANVGDWICSPYYYFQEFFSRYTCILHSDWSVLWHEIEKDDIVIFGGGGLLDNSDELNKVLNRLIDKCDNVIIWSAGTHKYNEDNIFGQKTAKVEINFDRVILGGIRDFNHPYNLDFLPCVSCLNSAFDVDLESTNIVRNVGTIKSALESSFAISDVPSFVSNCEPIGTIVNYILTSRIILVSSYHGAYWSTLLNRKVVLPSSRLGVDKYKYFKYPVKFYEGCTYNEEEILHVASAIPKPFGFLSEARQLNIDFFEKVKVLIESKFTLPSHTETNQTLAKRIAQLEFTVIELTNDLLRLNGRLTDVETINKHTEEH